MSLSLQLSSLPLRPSTLTLLQQRGFITLGEWNEAKNAGLSNLAAELQLDPVETQRIWKEVQECLAGETSLSPLSSSSSSSSTNTNTNTANGTTNKAAAAAAAAAGKIASLSTSTTSATTTSSSRGKTASELLATLPPTGIISFCRAIDQLFWTAGFPLGSLTEVAGLPGVGKTQLAMQLSVTARLPRSLGGVQGHTLYIDTEGSLVPERLYTMAQALLVHTQGTLQRRHSRHHDRGRDTDRHPPPRHDTLPPDFSTPEQVLEGIHVFRVYDAASLISTLYSLPYWIETIGTTNQNYNDDNNDTGNDNENNNSVVKLIVIDSIAFPFRSSPTPWQTTQSVVRLAAFLNDMAAQYQVAVVCVNQMTTKGEGIWVPALGDSWAHAVTTRLVLGQDKDNTNGGQRTCRLVKSPCLPPGTAVYQVTEQGIRDVVVVGGSSSSSSSIGSTTNTRTRDNERDSTKRLRTK